MRLPLVPGWELDSLGAKFALSKCNRGVWGLQGFQKQALWILEIGA